MIQSMTGYGRGIYNDDNIKLTVELKSVNSRFLDLNIKNPRKLNFLDTDIRSAIKSQINRGKIDVYISLEEERDSSFKLTYNKEVAKAYVENLTQISENFGIENSVRLIDLARLPEVLTSTENEDDEDALKTATLRALDDAIKAFKEARRVEGESLKSDILLKLDEMSDFVSFIEKRQPELVEIYKTKLREKVNELMDEFGVSIDENRFAMEVTMYADKVCVDEEIVRLNTHIQHVKEVLESGKDVGKKLDFLAQEMNRESNTILSKCSNSEISERGISLKTTIEKIREQIQNLE